MLIRVMPLSTSIPALDEALCGGFQPGSLNVIIGPSKCGKTTMLRRIFAQALWEGRRCAVFTEDRLECCIEALFKEAPVLQWLAGGDRPYIRSLDSIDLNDFMQEDREYDAVFIDGFRSDDLTQRISAFAQRHNIPVVVTIRTRNHPDDLNGVLWSTPLKIGLHADNILHPVTSADNRIGFKVIKTPSCIEGIYHG